MSAPEVAEEPPKREVPAALKAHQFQPGRAKTGGRRKLTPNRESSITIERIVKLADPIGVLCDIAIGKPMKVAPEPGSAVAIEAYPTMADRIAALKVLAAKVMPDLKQVAVDDGGSLVQVVLQLGQKVTVEAPDVTDVHYEVAGPTLEEFFASDDFVRVLVGPFG